MILDYWLQSLKQFFINVSYHILVASLTLMALCYDTLMKDCFKDWSPPPLTLGVVEKVKIQLFQYMDMMHIKLKGIAHAATWKQILYFYPLTPLHIAYQIKWNHECSNMEASIFTCRPPPYPRPRVWGRKVKIQLFQNMVMLHIKLNGHVNASTCKHIFCPYTHPRPWGGVKGQNNFFLKVVMLHIKLGGNGA